MYQQQQKKRTGFFDRIIRMLAMFGLSQALGIPFIGAIVGAAFKATAATASVAGDAVIAYSSADEAYEMIRIQMDQGATVANYDEIFDEYGALRPEAFGPDGIEVSYDTSAYAGEAIDADAFDMLGEVF